MTQSEIEMDKDSTQGFPVLSLVKTSLLVLAWLLAVVSLVILGYDALFHLQYGCDATDVAGVSNGDIIDWPTGERPSWALVPAFTYSIGAFLLASVAFGIRRRLGHYPGRVWRGAE